MSNWVQKDAAELLAISPRVMNYKIKTLGIEMPRRRHADGSVDKGDSKRFVTSSSVNSSRECSVELAESPFELPTATEWPPMGSSP